jgi:DNA-binding transcriptional LysR family regulator
MKSPDLNLLPIAFALYDELSVSRAARLLGMSQPAVSMALKRMREAYDDPLFIRVPTGITPTPRAHAIVRLARPLLGKLQEDLLRGESFDAASSTRTFTLALSDVGEMAFLPRVMAWLRARAPQCAIRSVAVPTGQLAHELEKGEVDLAVGYFPALSLKNVRQRRVSTQHWSCLMRADHPLCAGPLTLASFAAAEHIIVRAEGRSQEVLERFLERRRIRRNVALVSPHFLSVPFLVAGSNLIATMPHSVAVHFSTMSPLLVSTAPPFEAPLFDLKLHWHRRFDNEARSRWLRDQLAEVFREDPTMPQPQVTSGASRARKSNRRSIRK